MSLLVTEEAKNNKFEDCVSYGKTEVRGKGNSFIRTKFIEYKKEHPVVFWIGLISAIMSILGVSIISLIQMFE